MLLYPSKCYHHSSHRKVGILTISVTRVSACWDCVPASLPCFVQGAQVNGSCLSQKTVLHTHYKASSSSYILSITAPFFKEHQFLNMYGYNSPTSVKDPILMPLYAFLLLLVMAVAELHNHLDYKNTKGRKQQAEGYLLDPDCSNNNWP